jgi:hypothetical protein
MVSNSGQFQLVRIPSYPVELFVIPKHKPKAVRQAWPLLTPALLTTRTPGTSPMMVTHAASVWNSFFPFVTPEAKC